MARRSHLASIIVSILILTACGSNGGASSAASAPASAEVPSAPPGADATSITDWTDPRSDAWTGDYPLFAPISEFGDGSLERVQQADHVTVCSALGLVPWNFIDPATDEIVGVEVEFFAYISEKLGLPEAEYLNVEFQALIPALQAGQCDVIMSSLGIRADRAEQVAFSVPYMLTYDQFIVAQDSTFQSSDDLKGMRLGTFAGTADEDVLRAWVESEAPDSEILTFNTPNECFLATQNRTIDACFTDNVAVSAALHGEYSDLRALPEPFDYAAGFPEDAERSPYKLLSIATAFQSDDRDLNLAWSIAIQQMIDEGYAQNVLESWDLWDENQGDMIRPDA